MFGSIKWSRSGVISIATAIIAVIVAATVVLPFTILKSTSQILDMNKISKTVPHNFVNVDVLVIGSNNFTKIMNNYLEGKVKSIMCVNELNDTIVSQYAGLGKIVVMDSYWLKEHSNDVKIWKLIKKLYDAGTLIYIRGKYACELLKLLNLMGLEEAVRKGKISKEAYEIQRKIIIERYSKCEIRPNSGIGILKISQNHDIVIYGSLRTALKILKKVKTGQYITLSGVSPSQCEKLTEYTIDNDDFGTGDPYGDALVMVTVCKIPESIQKYDWYFYYIRFETVPGALEYNSGWETAHEYLYHKLPFGGWINWFWDRDPTDTDAYAGGSATVTISLSVEDVGWSYSESYVIYWLKIIDKSNFQKYRVAWEADFNEQKDPPDGPSTTSMLLKYGFIVKTLNGYCSFVDGKYGVMWGHPGWPWWSYKTFWTDTQYLDLCPWW